MVFGAQKVTFHYKKDNKMYRKHIHFVFNSLLVLPRILYSNLKQRIFSASDCGSLYISCLLCSIFH